jgi:signal transduction histidine kinase
MTATAEHPALRAPPRIGALIADPRGQTAIAVAGVAAAAGGGILVATSTVLVDPVAFGLQVAIMVLGTIAAALVWLRRRPESRVGPLLLALALATAPMSLQGADDEVLHSLGVLAEPFMFLLAYAVVFAFPDGRVTGIAERLLLAGIALYFLVTFLPWFLFSPVLSGGAPLSGCTPDCPANGFMIADRPAVAASITADLTWWVGVILTATLVCLVVRLATASRPRRRTLVPVYVPAVVLTVPLLIFHGAAVGLFELDPDTMSRAGWAVTIGRTALPFGFLLAIVQAGFVAGGALTRLVGRIGDDPNAAQLREMVADALDDPSVELVFRVDGTDHFVDSRGEPVVAAVARDGRATGIVSRQGETVGAIWHDPALCTDPELVRSASQAVLLALENDRLRGELQSATAELVGSRARIVAAGDSERRKVERDLHDGAQQRLVALRIKVELARELAESNAEVAARLADLGDGLEDAMTELRDLAHGVYPPLLRDFGLAAALGSAAGRCTPPAVVVANGVGRFGEDVEAAVYFCCLEGLQNVTKHAGADAHAEIRLSRSADHLRFEILDDGIGCDVATARNAGAGLANMTDRVAAVAGSLTVDSSFGHGTQVRGQIPVGLEG